MRAWDGLVARAVLVSKLDGTGFRLEGFRVEGRGALSDTNKPRPSYIARFSDLSARRKWKSPRIPWPR